VASRKEYAATSRRLRLRLRNRDREILKRKTNHG